MHLAEVASMAREHARARSKKDGTAAGEYNRSHGRLNKPGRWLRCARPHSQGAARRMAGDSAAEANHVGCTAKHTRGATAVSRIPCVRAMRPQQGFMHCDERPSGGNTYVGWRL